MVRLTTYLVPVVHPRAEFEMTSLVIERKVHHIDRTGWPELGRRCPEYTSVMIHHGKTSEQLLGIIVSTEITNITRISLLLGTQIKFLSEKFSFSALRIIKIPTDPLGGTFLLFPILQRTCCKELYREARFYRKVSSSYQCHQTSPGPTWAARHAIRDQTRHWSSELGSSRPAKIMINWGIWQIFVINLWIFIFYTGLLIQTYHYIGNTIWPTIKCDRFQSPAREI